MAGKKRVVTRGIYFQFLLASKMTIPKCRFRLIKKFRVLEIIISLSFTHRQCSRATNCNSHSRFFAFVESRLTALSLLPRCFLRERRVAAGCSKVRERGERRELREEGNSYTQRRNRDGKSSLDVARSSDRENLSPVRISNASSAHGKTGSDNGATCPRSRCAFHRCGANERLPEERNKGPRSIPQRALRGGKEV